VLKRVHLQGRADKGVARDDQGRDQPRSRKVADIAASPLVCYSVEDRAAFAYLKIAANAAVVEDAAQRQAKWDRAFPRFSPAGRRGTISS
jgi:hypothetical protein